MAIPDFFSPAFAAELAQQFPSPFASKSGWFLYNNPIEIKFASNDRTMLPACFNSAIDLLNSDHTRRLVSAISGVPFLEEVHSAGSLITPGLLLPSSERALQDPHLHGGGVHCHPPGGKLDMHLVWRRIYSRAAPPNTASDGDRRVCRTTVYIL